MRQALRKTESNRPAGRKSRTAARMASRALISMRRVRRTSRGRSLERLLEQHRNEFRDCRRRLRGEVATDVRDEMDFSVGHAVRAVGAAVAELSSGTVARIETALRRLANGRYGCCAECGHRIAAARLEVLPFAERCRDCQSPYDVKPWSEPPMFSAFQPSWARL